MTDADVPAVLIAGVDTAEVAYSLDWPASAELSFEQLLADRDYAKGKKKVQPTVDVGGRLFLLKPNGAAGYPLVLEGEDAIILCGPNNAPSFFVKYRSHALWKHGLSALHKDFLEWASAVGLSEIGSERLSRVDLAFDLALEEIDFDENSFVSRADHDAKFRGNRKVQGFQFGKGDAVTRTYDKAREVREKSCKTWLYPLWGRERGVWRVEIQARKALLRRYGIRTLEEFFAISGDLLRFCLTEHTSLRVSTADSNRSRWPLHPIWTAVIEAASQFDSTGLYREGVRPVDLAERETRLAIALHGYLKGCAAIQQFRTGRDTGLSDALRRMNHLVHGIHDELAFRAEVSRRVERLKVGLW